jgi:hypothetical protein
MYPLDILSVASIQSFSYRFHYIFKNKYKELYLYLCMDEPKPKLSDVVITDANTAFNVIVTFVNLAQQRGAFTLEESAKLWECVNMFPKK